MWQSSIPATLREPYAWAKIQQSPGNPEIYAGGLRGIELGGGRVNVPWREYERGYGSVVDTGTTFLYLPDAAHRSFLQLLGAHLDKRRDKIRRTRSPNPIYPEDLCFEARDPARVSREEVVAPYLWRWQAREVERQNQGQFPRRACSRGGRRGCIQMATKDPRAAKNFLVNST